MHEGVHTRIGFGTITFPVVVVWLAMSFALLRGHVADYEFAQLQMGTVTPGLVYESAEADGSARAVELARLAEGLVGIRYLSLLDTRERLLGTWAGPALGIGAWVARIAPDHGASQRVAAAAGLTRRGRFDAEHELWAGPLPPPPGRPSDRV